MSRLQIGELRFFYSDLKKYIFAILFQTAWNIHSGAVIYIFLYKEIDLQFYIYFKWRSSSMNLFVLKLLSYY